MITYKNNKFNLGAREVALVGVMAATLECGKFVLFYLPNIEVVTILCALYGYVFGWYGVAASVIFTLIEILIHGINTWVIEYLIYWPLVTAVFIILGRRKVSGRVVPTVVALGLTIFFGLLTSIIDTAVMVGVNEHFIKNVTLMYLRGIPFYINQIVCNLLIFSTSFPLLSRKMAEIRTLCRLDKM